MLCGDSRNPQHIALLMKEELAEAVITDPPYDANYQDTHGNGIKNDLLSVRRYKDLLFQSFSNSINHSKRGAAFDSFFRNKRHGPWNVCNQTGAPSSWYSDRKQTTLLQFPIEVKDRIHPTQKPKELIKYLLKNSTKEGDIVLDSFVGSGSTLFACEEMGRKAFICDD